MEKKKTRFDRMREENATLKPLLKKAGLPAPAAKSPAAGRKELSDQAAEAVARTLKLMMSGDKAPPPKQDG